MVSELSFGDVTHQADMSRSGLARTAAVEGAKIAAVPGATEQRRELGGFAAEGVSTDANSSESRKRRQSRTDC